MVSQALVQTLQLSLPQLLQEVLHDCGSTSLLRLSALANRSALPPPRPLADQIPSNQALLRHLEKCLQILSLTRSPSLLLSDLYPGIPHG